MRLRAGFGRDACGRRRAIGYRGPYDQVFAEGQGRFAFGDRGFYGPVARMTSSTRRQSPTALWAGTDTCTPCWWTAVARLTLGLEDLLTFAYSRIAHRQGRGGNVSPCRSHDCFNSRRSKGIFHAHTTAALLNSRSNALCASGNGRPSACMRWWVMPCIFWADNASCGLQSASSRMLPCVSTTPIWTTSLSLENPVVSVSIMSTSVRPRNMSNPFMYLVTGALSIYSIVEAGLRLRRGAPFSGQNAPPNLRKKCGE